MPYPSAPLPDTLAASVSCRILRSPCPVWCSSAGGGTPLCDSGRAQGGGNPTEELREEGEPSDLHLEPVKASGGVLGGARGPPLSPGLQPSGTPDPGSLARRRRPGRSWSLREVRSAAGPLARRGGDWRGLGPGHQGWPERLPRIVWRRTAPATARPAFQAPATRRRRCLYRERAVCVGAWGRCCGRNGGAGAGVGGAQGGRRGGDGGGVRDLCPAGGSGWPVASAASGPDSGKGPVGPRALFAVPSHKRLVDVKVLSLRSSCGASSKRAVEWVDYEDIEMKCLFIHFIILPSVFRSCIQGNARK